MNEYDMQLAAAVAAETTNKILSPLVSEAGKRAVLQSMAKEFQEFYGSDAYKDVLSEHKSLAEAISIAEITPSVQQSLPDLYATAFDCYQARRIEQNQAEPLAAPRNEIARLDNSTGRQKIIRDFEERYGTDVRIDAADSSQERFGY